MVQLWRVQQSYTIFGIVFWSLTITGIFYGYIAPKLDEWFGISEENVLVGLILLFLIVLFGILGAGFLYDRVLRLWREQTIVAYERMPYAKELLTPKEIVLWGKVHIRTLKEVAKNDPSVQADIEFMDRWVAKSMERDRELRRHVRELEEWVAG
jgi:hypothetical protein